MRPSDAPADGNDGASYASKAPAHRINRTSYGINGASYATHGRRTRTKHPQTRSTLRWTCTRLRRTGSTNRCSGTKLRRTRSTTVVWDRRLGGRDAFPSYPTKLCRTRATLRCTRTELRWTRSTDCRTGRRHVGRYAFPSYAYDAPSHRSTKRCTGSTNRCLGTGARRARPFSSSTTHEACILGLLSCHPGGCRHFYALPVVRDASEVDFSTYDAGRNTSSRKRPVSARNSLVHS
jgi:hypothetical protein